jgi:NAD(P)-dependent dehydrogenase (short-subunit alcohol dehydrogenase family)
VTDPVALSVVAGATGEIGRSVVARLVRDGHSVLALARRAEPLAELAALHGTVRTCAVDLGEDAAVEQIAAALHGAPVRMAVHMAAAPLGGHILETPASTVMQAVEVKVNGLLRLVRAVQPNLVDGSRVVAVGGNLAFDPVDGVSTAGIANAAQANAVRQLSRALGPRGVTCHTVAPGPVATERWQSMTASQAAHEGIAVEAVRARAAADSPLGRLITPDEVAWAIARLADPEAAALTGSTLLLDGGRRRALP